MTRNDAIFWKDLDTLSLSIILGYLCWISRGYRGDIPNSLLFVSATCTSLFVFERRIIDVDDLQMSHIVREKNMNVQRYSHLTEFKGYPVFRHPHQKIMQRHLPHIWPWMLQFGSPTPSWRWKPFKNPERCWGKMFETDVPISPTPDDQNQFPPTLWVQVRTRNKKIGWDGLVSSLSPFGLLFGNTHEKEFQWEHAHG